MTRRRREGTEEEEGREDKECGRKMKGRQKNEEGKDDEEEEGRKEEEEEVDKEDQREIGRKIK